MNRMSIPQALDIWHDLELARRGEHGFGGNTAEIYAYRISAENPLLSGESIYKALNNPDSWLHADAVEQGQQTKRDLCAICSYFEKRTESSVRVVFSNDQTITLAEWLASDALLIHRVHIRVEPLQRKK